MSQTIMSRIVTPTIDGMRRRGSPFRGILFAGLMITEGGPKLIEFNVQFGDPEAEVVLPAFAAISCSGSGRQASGRFPATGRPSARSMRWRL